MRSSADADGDLFSDFISLVSRTGSRIGTWLDEEVIIASDENDTYTALEASDNDNANEEDSEETDNPFYTHPTRVSMTAAHKRVEMSSAFSQMGEGVRKRGEGLHRTEETTSRAQHVAAENVSLVRRLREGEDTAPMFLCFL